MLSAFSFIIFYTIFSQFNSLVNSHLTVNSGKPWPPPPFPSMLLEASTEAAPAWCQHYSLSNPAWTHPWCCQGHHCTVWLCWGDWSGTWLCQRWSSTPRLCQGRPLIATLFCILAWTTSCSPCLLCSTMSCSLHFLASMVLSPLYLMASPKLSPFCLLALMSSALRLLILQMSSSLHLCA